VLRGQRAEADAPSTRRFLPAFDANKPTDQWFRATSGAGEFHIQVAYKPATVRLFAARVARRSDREHG